jgi:Short C-terminal domain
MPPLRRRPLTRAAMVGGAGYEIGKRHEAAAAAPEPVEDAASEANRIDALTKLKSLLDDGVLTQEQYDSEHARLTAGI